MKISDQSFIPERYTYQDYQLWKGDWELVNGYPFAMDSSHNKTHQWFASKLIQKVSNLLESSKFSYDCEAYYGLDWIIGDNTVVRPDCMIVCGNFTEDFLQFAPTLVVEISSKKTKLRDRNTKYNLYELKGVKYYVIADTEKKLVEVFKLFNGKYNVKTDTQFELTADCIINFDLYGIWQLM